MPPYYQGASTLIQLKADQPVLSGGNYVTGFPSMKRAMGIWNAI